MLTSEQKRKIFVQACEAEVLGGTAFDIDSDILTEVVGLTEAQIEEARQYVKRNIDTIRRVAVPEFDNYLDQLEQHTPEVDKPTKRVRAMHCKICNKTYDTRFKHCPRCSTELRPIMVAR